ncbi:MAG: alpha-glucosidase C-terminal domain-containing protein [Ignavibacteriales bacterium]|nr:alpha-glucosidase C-terminal domain-containing protein [Ignavibacteriales bacterium]
MKQIFIACLFFSQLNSQTISDILQPIRVGIDRSDTIVISDLFYAKNYNGIKFTKNNDLFVEYIKQKQLLVLRAKSVSFGATLLEFTFRTSKYYIPVLVNSAAASRVTHTFCYKPESVISTVTVEGNFNNWNKDSDPLQDADGDGTYERAVQLEPGSYIYKFVVDGKEIIDPSNPATAPTGFESYNSVLRVADKDSIKMFLHIGGMGVVKEKCIFTFLYDDGASKGLAKKNVVALLNNDKVNEQNIVIKGHTIEVRLPKKTLSGEKVLRVLVTQNGKNTNIQQVQLYDAVPAGRSTEAAKWHDGVIYSIMVDRFNNGNTTNDAPVRHDSIFVQANYQGGDFRGIIDKIESGYFDSLGINILWISPVYDNPNTAFREYPPPHRWYSGYHGYWPVNNFAAEEKFGTMDELKELVAKAHQRKIKVLLDIVAHHVHIDNPLFQEHPEWFGTLDLPDGRKNLRLWDEQRLTTWFEPYMPSFDYTKSDAQIRFMADNSIWWLNETGADGFRHDAVKHVPNEFWRALTRDLKEKIEIPQRKKVYQIGETFGDYNLVASYVNNGQLSSQFNFTLSYFAIPVFIEQNESFASLDFHMKKSFEAFGQYNLMGNIMDSHDKVRFMAYADGAVKLQGVDTREMAWNNPPVVRNPESYKKAALYYAYLFTIPGLPVIYYGSEFGMTGADDPDNRRMMRFGDSLTHHEKSMLAETQRIVKMRNNHSALRYGDFYTLRADTIAYAYIRADMNERLLVVLNKNDDEQNFEFHLPVLLESKELIDIISGERIGVKDNMVPVTVSGVHWRVLKIE